MDCLNIENNTSLEFANGSVDGGQPCLSPQEFDSKVDYNSGNPFKNLQGPPNNSKIKIYWQRGDVKERIKLKLTFSQYVSYQGIPKGSKMITKNSNIPSGSSYTGKGNGLNNPINLSYGKISKLYGGNSVKTMADGQKNAVFPDMKKGLAAAMHFYIDSYHGQNMCQINNRQQGYYSQDCSEMHDGVGMAALRLIWVTHNCKKMDIKPDEQLNLKDKNTLFTVVSAAAAIENGLKFQKGFLEEAYALVQNK